MNGFLLWLTKLITLLSKAPTPAPIPMPPPPPVVPVCDFSTQKAAFHATRVICDEIGLAYEQKDILCGCVFQESEFLVNPKPNQNIDEKTGKVWSTDYGIVQINDYYHIGVGKDFPSVEYVISHPEVCIRWMATYFKIHGNLKPWASYTSGAYKKHLLPGSRMWKLKT